MGDIEHYDPAEGCPIRCAAFQTFEECEHVGTAFVRAELGRVRQQLGGAVDRVTALERMLCRVLPYVHADPHTEHSALHDEAKALLNLGGQ